MVTPESLDHATEHLPWSIARGQIGATVQCVKTKGSIPALPGRHRLLRCVQCGVRGDSLLVQGLDVCPACGCDLLARPPRSYAEMEGLDEEPIEEPLRSDGGLQARVDAAASRWLLLLLGVMTGGLGMVAFMLLTA